LVACLFCVCALLCYVEALRRADHSSKESYRLWINHETEKAARAHKGCRNKNIYSLPPTSSWHGAQSRAQITLLSLLLIVVSLPGHPRPILGPTQIPFQWVPGAPSPG
jgi:hypothetical protein